MRPNRQLVVLFCASLFVGLFAASPCLATSIPAWLDDAITEYNAEHPDAQIRFVDIKDSFVWYMIPKTTDVGHQEIRTRVYEIVLEHGYKNTDEEELVTTAKPPSPRDPYKPKKCWRRSFVKNIEELADTKTRGGRTGMSQRMLTSLVCDDYQDWFAGFRIVQ